ncbi:MAG: hypothetical protein AB8C13_03390 [Phycisphaerales bacterium]
MPRTPSHLIALFAPTLALSTHGFAGLSDMYITDSTGEIYFVDGNTLEATSLAQLENAGTINDILYLGNGKILANLTYAIVSYDLNTGIQETLINTNGNLGQPGSFVYSSGLTRRTDGEIYLGITELLNPVGLDVYGISYNTLSQELSEVGAIPFPASYDFYELSNGNMIGFGTTGVSTLFNPNTGVIEAIFDLDIQATSFVQSLDELYVVAADGSLHTFDITDGSTEFYAQISGVDAPVFGASIAISNAALIPAPASMIVLTGGLGFGFRRRR